ncbi:hypothetical protein SASPL_108600 [Salvia splendens]|uniref:Uncharacterized protein n=1 Tax=Salvia splendens TaxID=180675 RepID=A0A8X8YCK0_SALSN|nr:hypothetical protein SASPL_108600 [Salvia splendens]
MLNSQSFLCSRVCLRFGTVEHPMRSILSRKLHSIGWAVIRNDVSTPVDTNLLEYMFAENPRQIELFIEYTPVTTALQFEPPITHHDVGTSRRDGYPSFDVGTSRRDDEYHSFEFNTSGREVDEPLDVPNMTCDGSDGSDNCDGSDDNVDGADGSDCDGSDGSQPSDLDHSTESCEDPTDDESLDMMVENYVQPSVRGEQSVPDYVPEGLPFFRSLPCEGSRVIEERRYWTARRELEKVSPEALRYLETTIDRSQWTMAHDEFRRWEVRVEALIYMLWITVKRDAHVESGRPGECLALTL